MSCRCKCARDRALAALVMGAICWIGAPAPGYAQVHKIDTVAFVVDADGDLISARAPQLQYGVERALRRKRRLDVHDIERRLALHAGRVPTERLSEAVGLLRAGEALLKKGNPAEARRRLAAAEIQLRQLLAHAEKAKLARAQFLIGVADILLGKPRAARHRFVRLQIWRPGFGVISKYSPEKVLPVWERARKQVSTLRGGSIVLTSVPAGALAYVDGRFVGTTPNRAEALPVGVHYVTFKLPGYLRIVAEARVSSRRQRKLRRRLQRAPGYARLRRLVARASKQLGRSQVAVMKKLGAMVHARHLVFVRRAAAGSNRYEAYVYDAKTTRRLAAVRTSLPAKANRAALRKLARGLYAGIKLEQEIKLPPLVARKPKKPKKHRKSGKSIFGRWWFWAGLAVGAAIPAVLSVLPDSGPSCPAGFMCGRLRF